MKIKVKDWAPSSGHIQYGYVPWDSEIFGHPFYEIMFPEGTAVANGSLHDLLTFLRAESEGKCLLFTRVRPSDIGMIRRLSGEGFYQVETVVEPFRDLRSFQPKKGFAALRLRPAVVEDMSHLLALARGAFSMDRFHLDPNLSNDRAGYRYEYWLGNGFKSGESIMAYENAKTGKIVGFCHIKEITRTEVDFSLAAIDKSLHKTGLGVMMYSDCLAECRNRGYESIRTRISVNNTDVLNIYSHLGFLFRRPMATLHLFFE